MFTQILVPLDGSELAERALPAAERLATATGATLHLVRAVGVPQTLEAAHGPTYLPGDIYEDLIAWETEAARAYLAAARERVAGESRVTARAVRGHLELAASIPDIAPDFYVEYRRTRRRGGDRVFVAPQRHEPPSDRQCLEGQRIPSMSSRSQRLSPWR